MASYQQTLIIGHVGSVTELKYTQSGTAVHSFSVAVTDKWTDANGQKQEKTNWYRVSCWKGLAEVTAKYVTKGMAIMVSGNVEASAYTAADGSVRANLELTARDVQFLSRSEDSGQSYDPASGNMSEDVPF